MCPPLSTPLLDVAVHLQDDPDACGQACSEMVLLFLTNVLHQQTDLGVPLVRPGWQTSPEQLCTLINDRLPARFPRYHVFSETTRTAALNRVWRALNINCPAVALSAQNHWIVVHGITDGTPAVAHFRNPLPDRLDVLDPPLPKHTTDDKCPVEDLLNSSKPNGEVASVCSRFCMEKASRLPAGDEFLNHYVVIAPDGDGDAQQFRCPARSAHITMVEAAWDQLRSTNVLTRPGWREFAALPLADNAVSINIEALSHQYADDAFTLVRLMNKAGGVLLVSVTRDGEFIAAMLEPAMALWEAQFDAIALIARSMNIQTGPAPIPTVRAVWQYSRELLFSPFVFALEVEVPGGPPHYVRPFDNKQFDSWSDPGA